MILSYCDCIPLPDRNHALTTKSLTLCGSHRLGEHTRLFETLKKPAATYNIRTRPFRIHTYAALLSISQDLESLRIAQSFHPDTSWTIPVQSPLMKAD